MRRQVCSLPQLFPRPVCIVTSRRRRPRICATQNSFSDHNILKYSQLGERKEKRGVVEFSFLYSERKSRVDSCVRNAAYSHLQMTCQPAPARGEVSFPSIPYQSSPPLLSMHQPHHSTVSSQTLPRLLPLAEKSHSSPLANAVEPQGQGTRAEIVLLRGVNLGPMRQNRPWRASAWPRR